MKHESSLQGKILRIREYGRLLREDCSACIEKRDLLLLLRTDDRFREWLFGDWLLSVYLLIFDVQKEQRSVSYANLYDLLLMEKKGTKEALNRSWSGPADDFERQYRRVMKRGRLLLESDLRKPMKMVRDKVLTHHEIKTAGSRRRVYRLADFPEITPQAVSELLHRGKKRIDDASALTACVLTPPVSRK